ncbi:MULTISPECIES: hypothetical protein [Ralstonia solanacearum species complex]|nr:hypothetical protein [Ralstonia solanacearum]ALF90126.1 hypothetical protein RSUY_38170 [Ralstonia solanacearum]ATI29611.1 hypothetical protein CCY86_19115 [Ralstonia solanacearum]NUU70345.1 hypothetical protein [Ralstonia solanacearum]OPK47086.1 hypothetical protein B5G54_16520 [Ralstonia solanacearum]OPK50489.1 hypothetical protein B5S37_20105 [Ralstonia solanacearum]
MAKERSDNAGGSLHPRSHKDALPRRSDDLSQTGSDPILRRSIGTLACTKTILAVTLLVSTSAIAAPDEEVVQNMARHSREPLINEVGEWNRESCHLGFSD